MCGIAGYLDFSGDTASCTILRGMTDAIAHRGPDGEGHYVDGACGLGHRRLAIIDLSPAGHQPMQTADLRYVISYNGEVYNFLELRTELEALGHRFHSSTDTEVILEAYAQWGPACISRFNGMFAFVIWDRQEKALFLARDRYGIKPLYYAFCGHMFIFASEIKAILQHPSCRPGLDKEALLEYFTFQNFFTDRTLWNGVRMFPAGHHATIRQTSSVSGLEPVEYWDFSFTEPDNGNDDTAYVEEFDRLFRQAVDRQLVSDVELGSYLSGGMDSGSITAVAAGRLPYIKTFTCGFDLRSASGLELGYDEREKAEYMSYVFRTEHYEMVLKSGDMERCMQALVHHLEEPRVGQSYPNYYAAKLASRFVKVCLAGTGGDELFGGYPWRYYRAVTNDTFEQYVDKYYAYWQRLIPNTTIHQVFAPIWNDVGHVWTRDIFRDVFRAHAECLTSPVDYVNHSLYFEAKTFLHGLLVVEDKLSMAHSLETRVPFLDNDLVDFAMHVPVRLKLRRLEEVARLNENEPGQKLEKYFQRTRDGKLLLREAMRRYIPQEITDNVKQGFSAPDASWFRGDSMAYVRRRLLDRSAAIYDLLDRDAILALVNEHLNGGVNRRLLIWSLLNIEELLQQHFC